MGVREDLLQEKAAIERRLSILNSAPSDTFNFGTVALFVSGPQGVNKALWQKIAEERWYNSSGNEMSLSEAILYYHEADIGYFEIYILTVPAAPLYASA